LVRTHGVTAAFTGYDQLLNHALLYMRLGIRTQVRTILDDTEAWLPQFTELFCQVDQYRPSRSAESIIVLMISIAERYAMISNVDVKLRFFESLQRYVMEQYLREIRVEFLANQMQLPALCALTNSCNYIAVLLEEWQYEMVRVSSVSLGIGCCCCCIFVCA
jgi:hypothetical protein